MSSDSENDIPKNGAENCTSNSNSTGHSDDSEEACKSPTQESPHTEDDEIEKNRNEIFNFNYMDAEQMEIKDECDSKSDGSREDNGTGVEANDTSNKKSPYESRSISREKEYSVSPKKSKSDRRSQSQSRKRSRSSSRGHSRSASRKRSRSHGRRRSRSRSKKRSRSNSRKRSSSRGRRERYSTRRSRSRSRKRRGSRKSHSRSRTPPEGARLHIAEIDVDTSKRDLEKLFGKFGRMREVWMAHNPPCFAFVVFERQKDAEDAQRETNGEQLGRSRIRVTLARPRTRGGRFRGAYDPNMRCYQCGEIGHFSRNCTDTKFGYKRPPSPLGRRARRRSMSRSRSHSRRRSRS